MMLSLGQPKDNKVKNVLLFSKVYETCANQVSRWHHEPVQSYLVKKVKIFHRSKFIFG